MITNIKKKDGREIHFSPEKITRAIFLAASRVAQEEGSKVDYETAEVLTERVANLLNSTCQSTTPTVESMQDAVVKVSTETDHARVSEAYILYRVERTGIRNTKTRLMESTEEITFADSDNADIKHENTNIDGNMAMDTILQYGSAVSKEFRISQLMNPQHAALHENRDVHIHDMNSTDMGTLTCCQIDLEKSFNGGFSTGHGHLHGLRNITSYAALVAIAIQSNQNDRHDGQNIPVFDLYLAKGVAKTFRKEYISSLNKTLELLINLDADVGEPFKAMEKKIGETAAMITNDSFLNSLNAMLEETSSFGEEQIELTNKFAYKEASVATKRKTCQAVGAFIHNLNTMHSRADAQVPFSSIDFGTDMIPEGRLTNKNLMSAQEAGLGNGETPTFPVLIFKVKEGINYNPRDLNYDLFKLAMRVFVERLFPSSNFIDTLFNKQYYKEGHPETEATYVGCRTRVVGNINGPEIATGRGNSSLTPTNLPCLRIKHGVAISGDFNEAVFFNELDEKMEIVTQQLSKRLEIQGRKKVKNLSFLMGQGVRIDSENPSWEDTLEGIIKQGTLTVGFIGLTECLKVLIGEHCGESGEVQKFGLRIVGHTREMCDEAIEKYSLNFSLIVTPTEGPSGRFTRIDKKVYGITPGVTGRGYYTNSFHTPVYCHITAFKKIQKEIPYHEFANGGHTSYVEVNGDPTNNLGIFEFIAHCMKDAGTGYGSINHPIDRDPCCGYSGVIEGHVYLKCGRDEHEEGCKSEEIRRITGYLVGTVDRFDDAKASGERDCIEHG